MRSIGITAKKLDKLLKLTLEVVTFEETSSPRYVYYKKVEKEPIPIYWNKKGKPEIQKIYKNLKGDNVGTFIPS